MASSKNLNQHLTVAQLLRKRRSEEKLVSKPKRMNLASIVAAPIEVSSPERCLNDKPLPESDGESQPLFNDGFLELEKLKAELRTKRRIYQQINRTGEQEQWMQGYCCNCESYGNIMAWPNCKNCLHNSCKRCDVATNTTNVDEEERRPCYVEKLEELSGECEL